MVIDMKKEETEIKEKEEKVTKNNKRRPRTKESKSKIIIIVFLVICLGAIGLLAYASLKLNDKSEKLIINRKYVFLEVF